MHEMDAPLFSRWYMYFPLCQENTQYGTQRISPLAYEHWNHDNPAHLKIYWTFFGLPGQYRLTL